MKTWLIPTVCFGLAGAVGCSRSPTLLVTVANLPQKALSLQVQATHGGAAAASDLEPYELAAPTLQSTTFLLRLPGSFSGDIEVSVGAFDQPGGKGCLLGAGSHRTDTFSGPNDSLSVSLEPATDTTCTGKRPLLLTAAPGLGSTAGGETVKLTGWGFRPDSTLTMNGKGAQFSFVSAAQLLVNTPAGAGIGPTTIRIANRDGGFDSRKDLFRFFTNTLSFSTTQIPGLVVPFLDTSGFAVSIFDPATTADLAIALSNGTAPGVVRVLFTTNGTPNFTRMPDYTVGKNPGPLVAGDFDKDGDQDLMVANIDDGTLQLLRNDGAGNFTVDGPVSAGSLPFAMAAGDLDADGDLDLVVGNKLSGTPNVQVFLNQGNGTLLPTLGSPFTAGKEPVSVAIGDLDGDGRPEIAVANQLEEMPGDYIVSVLLNQGGGTFIAKTNLNLTLKCKKPTSVQIQDTNGDGKQDVLVSCIDDNKVVVALNLGFLLYRQYELATETAPRNLTLADLNGDGFADLIVPAQGKSSLNLFLNKQGAGFEGVTYASRDTQCSSPYLATVLDLNNDGTFDVGVAGLGSGTVGCVSVLSNLSN